MTVALGPLAWTIRERSRQQAGITQRLEQLAQGIPAETIDSCPAPVSLPGAGTRAAAWLASWQTIGGCGAGAASGSGAAVKWIGRGVTGGLFQVQCQANYTNPGPGRRDIATIVQLTTEVTDRWSLGLALPYLYKDQNGFPRADLKLSNKGPGDVNLMVARRFGPLRATSVSLWAGLPTGTHEAEWQVGAQRAPLPHDLQLGIGRPSASLVLDHVIDHSWGPTVLGATANYRGGRNNLGNSRAPNGSAHAYTGYLLGAFVPAVGATLTGALDHDLSLGQPRDNPKWTVALNASIEWSTDWVALLLGAAVPYGKGPSGIGREPWMFGLGASFAPF